MERKRIVSWLAAAGLAGLLLWQPGVRAALLEQAKSALGSEGLLRAVFFLEAGVKAGRGAPGPAAGPAPATDEPSLTGEAPVAAVSDHNATGDAAADDPARMGAADDPARMGAADDPARDTGTDDPAHDAAGNAPATPSEATTPEPEATAATEGPEAPTAAPFTAEEAEGISFRGNCTYEADKTALLLAPLNWPDGPGPKVLIIHSHACESYTQCEGHTYLPSANYRTLDLENNMIAVGDALAEALGELGVEVVHDRSLNDYPSYNASYATAREKIQAYLEEYPSIVMVLDLHRDALDQPVRETVERDGRILAPLMLVVGTDQGGLNHPHWEDNLSCALKLQALGNRDAPSLFKRLSFRKERFNGDLTRGSLIVEVGSTENTLPEAVASMEYLAAYVAELLRCA